MVGMVMVMATGVAPGHAEDASKQQDSCIVTLDTGLERCYPSLAEMVTVETNGRYKLPPNGAFTPAEVEKFSSARSTQTSQDSRSSLALGVNATFWDGQSYTGGAVVLEASSGCGSSAWTWNVLTPTWQNRVESGKGYRQCNFKVFADTYLNGAGFGYFLSATSLLNLNNNAESVRLQN